MYKLSFARINQSTYQSRWMKFITKKTHRLKVNFQITLIFPWPFLFCLSLTNHLSKSSKEA